MRIPTRFAAATVLLVTTLLTAWPTPGHASGPAIVQQADKVAANATSLTDTLTATTAGDELFALIATVNSSGTAPTVNGISDTGGDTWQLVANNNAANNNFTRDAEIWWTTSTTRSSTSATISLTNLNGNDVIRILEVSGAPYSLDRTKLTNAPGFTNNPDSGTTATTTGSGDFALGIINANSPATYSTRTAGYTQLTPDYTTTNPPTSPSVTSAWTQLSGATTTHFGATMSDLAAWSAIVAAFALAPVSTPWPSPTAWPQPTPIVDAAYPTPCPAGTATPAPTPPTPTPTPTPASTPLTCATQITDPQELGSIQDTVIIFGCVGVALLAAIVWVAVRR